MQNIKYFIHTNCVDSMQSLYVSYNHNTPEYNG
jgi:hypothetical protein